MIKKSKADINKNGKIEGWESARSKAIAKSMAKKKTGMKKGGTAKKGTHVTKEGKVAKKVYGTTFIKKENVVKQ